MLGCGLHIAWHGFTSLLTAEYQLHSCLAPLSVFFTMLSQRMQEVLPSSSRKNCLQKSSVQNTHHVTLEIPRAKYAEHI